MRKEKGIKVMFVKKLDQIGEMDIKKVGGKGANLGAMIEVGLPVPGGFVVLTNAYLEFIDSNNLKEQINLLLKEAKHGEESNFEEISAKIKKYLR